ncbi:MAG: cyclase family protein [Gemmatales bacterium]|nr:cyclase family protein [Gemmatales bacterium]MDW7993388.1 cyclase family protein [Gemmatales bacterium]
MRRNSWMNVGVALVGVVGAWYFGRWQGRLERGSAPLVANAAVAQGHGNKLEVRGWQRGRGWGWIWGKDDEIGALNAMTNASRLAALKLVQHGRVYDLGVTYSRRSYRWPGHNAGEIITFRSPEGLLRQRDFPAAVDAQANPRGLAWHSCALFLSDNVGTQIDGLGHVTAGEDHHWYNGYREADWGGNFGIRKCDVAKLPPIVARGVLIDVAGFRKVEALPSHYRISVEDLQGALQAQRVELRVGDVVLIRTGMLRYWGEDGADHEKLRQHDSAGIDLAAARWLVEQHGAMLIGSDTSGLEYTPGPGEPAQFLPVHHYLLIEQGVPIGEFHYLEELARDRVYEFCYICTVNKIRGTTAGFCLRPIALR